jgi:hypothetical protein
MVGKSTIRITYKTASDGCAGEDEGGWSFAAPTQIVRNDVTLRAADQTVAILKQ